MTELTCQEADGFIDLIEMLEASYALVKIGADDPTTDQDTDRLMLEADYTELYRWFSDQTNERKKNDSAFAGLLTSIERILAIHPDTEESEHTSIMDQEIGIF